MIKSLGCEKMKRLILNFTAMTCFAIYLSLFYFLATDKLKNVNCFARIDPLVETKVGLIRGLLATDGDYSMFLGIPYATIDKDNPFGPSHPRPKFDSVFEAFNESAICPQYDRNEKKGIGTIDCLHMNIFVPNKASSLNRLPVMIWIYGGRFEFGNFQTTILAPRFLLRHDIIVVIFNYRTGPYGFMCLDTPEVPGNAGLKDQLIALRWIKDNIESFGGNVNQITLAGQSAGSVSVDFHLMYDKETFFQKAILNSGTAECPWAIIDSDRNEPLRLAEILGYNTHDFNDAMSFLSKVDPTLVVAAKYDLATVSRACVEKKFDNVENFITDYPMNMEIPKVQTTPILVGFNDDELIAEYIKFPKEFFTNPNLFREELSIAFNFGNEADEMANFYKHFYTGDNEGDEVKLKIIDFESDLRFNYPTHKSLRSYLENGAKDVYFYIFSYLGSRNIKFTSNVTIGGASHGDQVPYIFDSAIYKDVMFEEDQVIVDRMTTMYTNFVKYGDPTPATTDLLPVKWIPITNDALNYLNIDIEMNLRKRPFHERITFWNLFYKLNKRALKGYREQ